ncbi:MAG TPA: BBE domain-containing protein, partial [Acidimicrobiales bacterium]|nr:BBE domain-containing protein [Acidimicrobiales bacterium]
GGLTLGGGLGHLMRKLGLTVDSLNSVDLVTADAEVRHIDAHTDPDLFWGLRGGGGNFGVATAFEYQLHPVGPMVLGGPVVWPLSDAPAVVQYLRDFAPDAPHDLGITIGARLAPPMVLLPAEAYGQPVFVVLLVWAGDPAVGQDVIAPLRRLGSPIADVVKPAPYLFLQSMLDGGAPHGMHYYWKSHRLPTLDDDVVEVVMDSVASITSPFSQISGWAVGGAVSAVDADATAVGEREPGFEVNIVAAWMPGDPEPARHVAWVRKAWERMRPHSAGVYTNFLSDEGSAGVQLAYGGRLERLRELKGVHDPDNFFRMNANIEPSADRREGAA